MKFDTFKQNTDFTLLLNAGKPTASRFRRAFQKYETFPKDSRVIHDRAWCRDVLEMFSMKMHIPFALGVQSFKTGNMDSLWDFHKREAQKYVASLANDQLVDVDQVNYRFANMQQNKFYAEVREAFSWGLGLRHPTDGNIKPDADKEKKAEKSELNRHYVMPK